MIYKQLSYLPIIFQVDEGVICQVDVYLKRSKLSFTNVLVVAGKEYSKKIATKVVSKNKWTVYALQDNSYEDVEKLKEYVNAHNIDLLIGVGGGKVIDTVKRVSYLSSTNNLSIPTIISNDGLISPISVIKNEFGKAESLPAMMPMGVIIDIDIIKESPSKFLQAAAGDVLANLSATNDWILAFQQNKETMNDVAFHLSKSAANSLLHYSNVDLRSKSFLRLLIQGLVNSGIAMGLSGTSRPCSGSEHQISHAIDYLGFSDSVLHGTQVGSISLFTLYLQGKLKLIHINFAKSVGIPLQLGSLVQGFSKNKFLKIVEKARLMRPGRYTVLDELTNEEICRSYEKYNEKLNALSYMGISENVLDL